MEQSQNLPKVDISFAPTNAFVKAHDEKTVEEQTKKFSAPSWAGRIAPKSAEVEKPKPKQEVVAEAEESRDVLFVIAGVFFAGVFVGGILLWQSGLLRE